MNLLFRDIGGASPTPAGSVVCIGAFDGLHLGHRALVDRAASHARALGVEAVALSFEPLPREFFGRASPPPRLSLPRARYEGLRALGADRVGLLRFNADLEGVPVVGDPVVMPAAVSATALLFCDRTGAPVDGAPVVIPVAVRVCV